MQSDRDSFRKTVWLASGAGALTFLILVATIAAPTTLVPAPLRILLYVFFSAFTLASAALALSGLLVIYRDLRNERAELDLFDRLNLPRSEARLKGLPSSQSRLLALRGVRRMLGAPSFVVGDRVRVRALPEILATLDSGHCLDALPFMPEMARYCGQEARVFRSVDKIYDYGGRKDMRRMSDCVTLTGLRCDGSAHDGCQAGCALLWKTAWLESVAGDEMAGIPELSPGARGFPGLIANLQRSTRSRAPDTYSCQFTALVKASSPMSVRDIRQDLRPLIAGNVTVSAFLLAMASRYFNWVQGLRGGIGYLTLRPTAETNLLRVDLGLREGDSVFVRSREEIAATLNIDGRNRGLWFDRDMLKHCGRQHHVHRVVERIIDDATGRMLTMKTPCLVIDSVTASGEFMRFCPQHDYPFWREAWLHRADAHAASRPCESRSS